MKRIFSNTYFLSVLMLFVAVSCMEEYNRPSEKDVPLAANIDVDIVVDQEINQVTFNLKNKSSYPVWIFEEPNRTEYSTINGLTKIYAVAGTYTVEIKIGNTNGVSDGSITRTFTINNSMVNFDLYVGMLAGSGTKNWSIARTEAAHLACGPSGTIGTEWWSAAPDEKANEGVYDDLLTFGNDYSYTYNPGSGGTVYVNKDVTVPLLAPHNTHDGNDFMAPVSEQNTTYSIVAEGNDVFVVFPAGTLFPYIANDDAYNTPKYKLAGISSSRIVLVIDNGGIAWHYILTAGKGPGGYDPNNDCNKWKTATFNTWFWYAPGWNQIADPGFEADGNSYRITLPEATFEQWQAQMAFLTNMSTEASKKYDFSAIINSNKAHGNVTVKLVHESDDGVFYFEEGITLKANEDYTFIKTGMDGMDIQNLRLFLDFGGNEANTIVTVSRIVLKENSCDDGTVIEEPEEPDNVNWLPNSDCNLWKNVDFVNHFYYAPGWSPIYEGPAYSGFTGNTNSYTISYPTATSDQWQNQVHFRTTNIATTVDKSYDFRCILNSTKNINGVTIKLTKVGDDATAFFTRRVNIIAFEDHVFKMPNMEGLDIDNISLVFDFGGNPDNTEVTISSIILKESTCND
ncbi:MAG: hypothetical protein KF845_10525 [Cyclobacteriaceae bacterium]|nr:hypothetical protein [Cyclobacteriaceae bacterium]